MEVDTDSAPKKKKKNFFRCCVAGCETNSQNKAAKLHSFPNLDEKRAQKWLIAVNRLELVGRPTRALARYRVCDLHFHAGLRRGKGGKLWDCNAIPTLHLAGAGDGGENSEMQLLNTAQCIPTPALPTPGLAFTPGYIFILPKTGVAARTPGAETVDSSGEGSDMTTSAPAVPLTKRPTRRFPREFARLLVLRHKLKRRNTAGKGYFDKNFSIFALNLYLSCPATYRALWKSLRLPPVGVLARVHLGIGTCITDHFVTCLDSKLMKADPREKECILCIDEVELDRKLFYAIDKDEIVGFEEIGGMVRCAAASRALVFAARGARSGWTQPLGYYYLADDTNLEEVVDHLKKLIVTTLCHKLGCTVIAVVSALGPTFTELARAFGVLEHRPFLVNPRSGKEISYVFDLDQLILTLRDTLMAYDIKFKDTDGETELVASWRDVRALAREDEARPLRLVPALGRACSLSTSRDARDVRHATALFSRSVAAHMSASNAVEACATGTVRLLQLVAELRAPLVAPLTADLTRTEMVIEQFASCLGEMTLVSQACGEYVSDADVYVRCLRVAMSGLRRLLADSCAATAAGAPLLRLSNYSLKPVRRFIEEIEGERGHIAPVQFRRRFRRWAMRSLLEPFRMAHRRDNIDEMLIKVQEPGMAQVDSAAGGRIDVGSLEHRVDVCEDGSMQEVARRLLEQCRRVHRCSVMAASTTYLYELVSLIAAMNDRFKEMFSERILNVVGLQLLPALAALMARGMPCPCFPVSDFCRLFVRFRIRAALIAHNRSLRPGAVLHPDTREWLFQ